MRPDDGDALRQLHDRLSPESLYSRHVAFSSGSAPEVARLLCADHDREFVLVAESGGRLSGVACYSRDPHSPERAEDVRVRVGGRPLQPSTRRVSY